ncbi:translation initiation factor 2 subunit beta (aeIF-2b) [Haloferax larsenii]|uniref:Translation initiation factor 2 subunit beta (AeIF-2b) n=2 Tax=Haloferax larsenii TaxID=302484 RepID=A0A1H7SG56_HALLR|nr:translation initiation factor 2 subunit beta (aeIF-2b) [Haloferax larsenii]
MYRALSRTVGVNVLGGAVSMSDMGYEDHLDRALSETPDTAERGDRFSVPDPVVRQEGNVTVYENFADTHDTLAREPNHVLKFLQTEMGTSAQIDAAGRARLTGSFKQRRVADALDEYVESFVRCSECGSPDTRFVTEQGAKVMKCDACGALSAIPDI